MVERFLFLFLLGNVWAQPITLLDNEFHVQSIVLGNNPVNTANVVEGNGFDGLLLETAGGAAEHLSALEAKGKKLYALWRPLNQNWDQDLSAIKNSNTHLVVQTAGYNSDEDVIRDMVNLADRVANENRMVLLYPHVNFHIEIGREAITLLDKMKQAGPLRENIGLVYTFAHTLNYYNNRDMDYTADVLNDFDKGFNYIKAVSIAGSDSLAKDWGGIIQPLDKGNFDNFNLVKILVEKGYKGAFTLQAYGIPDDPNIFMGNSYQVWESWQSQLMGLKGCGDSNFIEFDPKVTHHDSSACKTLSISNKSNFQKWKMEQHGDLNLSVFSEHKISLIDIKGNVLLNNWSLVSKNYNISNIIPNSMVVLKLTIGKEIIIQKLFTQ